MKHSAVAEVIETEASTTVRISGVLDERAELTPRHFAGTGPVVFDLGGILGINSLGIKSWVQFVNRSTFASETILVRNCTAAMLDQFAMIPSAKPAGAELDTFFLVAFCEGCRTERTDLLTAAAFQNGDVTAPACDGCGGSMDYEDLETVGVLLGRDATPRRDIK